MKYDFIISITFYICGCFYMIFGAYMLAANAKSYLNRLYVTLTSSLAIWAIAFSISSTAPTAEGSAFWAACSTFGWGTFYSLFFHFILILTKTDIRLKKRTLHAIIYVPALINIFLFAPFGFHAGEQYEMVWTDFGWTNEAFLDIWEVWFIAYYLTFITASLVVLIRWWKNIDPNTRLKRQTTYFLISILIPLFLGISTETVPTLLGISYFPKLTIVFLMIPITTLFLASRKLGLLLERKKEAIIFTVAEGPIEGDRDRLFKITAAVFTLGSALSFLIGYFGMKKVLEYELLLAGSLLAMAAVISFIPYITKKHSVQNNIFLIVCELAFIFFMIKERHKGGLTVWAVYALFLMFTVILDSRIHAVVYTVLCILFQVYFWIAYPEVTAIIDVNEYATRIFIILLVFFTVRYLTNEYALKIKGYRSKAREQEVLEKISTSFISLHTENAHEKLNEMFQMADEILEFDQAFFIEFDKDYDCATILNVYVEDDSEKTFPYYPGMTFKVASSPMFSTLIEQKTIIMCDDAANIPFDIAPRHEEDIKSRGIKSFYVIPIEVDGDIRGVFVVEYKKHSDSNLSESRLNFIKILANILGDAKKKTLYEEMLYDFAYFDETTKLANWNMLRKRLGEMIDSEEESEKIAIIDIELENLRIINDTFGHSVGQQVVVKSAEILQKHLEHCCDISRASDEGFVVVLPHAKNREQIEECTQSLVAAFSRPVVTQTGVEALFVVTCMGISVYPDDGTDADTLLKNADLAKYEAKNTNEKIVFYTERLENKIVENTLMTNRLFKSLENEEFFLEFQPQISCNTGKTSGIEALLRWTSDGTRRVPPDKFIPILEQTGLIYDVGLWVLEQTLQEHNRLIAKGFLPLRVSVNLSVVQFQEEEFISDVRKIIEESGVDPKYIELEITESLFSKDPEDVMKKLHQLKGLGVSIAIDDFGKGYSSLNRLKRVPFDRLKIDKEIIDYIDAEREKAPITEIVIQLGKAFRAAITAEGVETKGQADFLRNAACDEIQGYYYSKPLSPAALEEFLKEE